MGKDSSELLWDDINRTKFYSLLTAASATIRLCLYPAALVKTRLQAHGHGEPTPAATTATATATSTATSARSTPTMPKYRGTGHAFRTILATEGKFALYRGFRMNLLGLACDPIVIGCIEFSRTRLTYYSEKFTPYHPDHYASPFFKYVMSPSTAITLLSAGGSACVGQIIQVPVDVISQKKQMQLHPLQNMINGERVPIPHGTSSYAIAKQIVDAEGIRGLYKGFGITLCSATPFQAILWAVYWPTQRTLHNTFTHFSAPQSSSASPPFSATLPPASVGLPTEKKVHPPVNLKEKDLPEGAHLPRDEKEYLKAEQAHEKQRMLADKAGKPHPHVEGQWSINWRDSAPTPLAAFVASSTASLLTQPIDVLKTRLQVAGGRQTIMSTVRVLIKERGYRGLCAGWYPRLLAVTPGTTIMMSSYEILKRFCQK